MMVIQIYPRKMLSKLCLLSLFLCHITNAEFTYNGPSHDVCLAEQDSPSCIPPTADDGENSIVNPSSHFHPQEESKDLEDESVESDSLLHRGMQGLEAVLDKMATSRDQMMHDMIERMSESRAKMKTGLESMMDKMSESRIKVMKGLDTMMEKVVKAKEEMKESFDSVIDQVSHSKMMEEFDLVLESIKQSKVLMEIRALPEELRQSFILSARNRSYIAAGILVAISSAILFGGAIYYAWCHHDAWSYYIGTIDEAKALLNQYKESAGLLSRSRSRASSETSSVCNENVKEKEADTTRKTNGEASCKEIKGQDNIAGKEIMGMEANGGYNVDAGHQLGSVPNSDCEFLDDDDVFEELIPSNHENQNGNLLRAKEGDNRVDFDDDKQVDKHRNDTS